MLPFLLWSLIKIFDTLLSRRTLFFFLGGGCLPPWNSYDYQQGEKIYDSQVICVHDRKKLGVSGPDLTIKCTVVFNVLCIRSQCTVELCPAWPMWNHVEQRPVTLHPGHPAQPPPHQATGGSVYLQLPRRMNLDCVQSRAAQSEPAATGQYMCILFFISHPVILSFGTPPKWFIRIVLIVVIF
jgi:hypothetical protein